MSALACASDIKRSIFFIFSKKSTYKNFNVICLCFLKKAEANRAASPEVENR